MLDFFIIGFLFDGDRICWDPWASLKGEKNENNPIIQY
jgi:hypothetical protein